ncbi:MAG: cell wall-binding repeat-containing protein [Ornithinimicrobium sp.]|uniref:cell wall-binding repeat-containing protein n=1 Tax=Ornithinimicrobium sp. TaxID=1977084 RepID=UPI003D9AFD8D
MNSGHSAPRRGLALASAATLAAAVTAAATLPTSAATSSEPSSAVTSPLPAAEPALPGGEVERIGGEDRYETAALVAAEYPESVETVYIATGELFPDALSAGSPAGSVPSGDGQAWPQVDGSGVPAPVLLTEQDALPEATIDAIEALEPTQIIIVGGEAAVNGDVQTALEAYADVERLAGEDRYATSAAIAEQYPTGLPVVFLATGENFPDALTGGAVAGRSGAPILLTDGDELSDATAQALTDLEPRSVVVFGGSAAVSDTVLDSVTAIVPDTARLGGVDRYETAGLIAEGYEPDLDTAYLATGLDYPDALTGSALAGFEGVPLLLTKQAEVPEVTELVLDVRLSPQGITLLGGPAAIDDDVARQLEPLLAQAIDFAHLQVLSFNDYHGHLEDEDATLDEDEDPDQNIVGGAEYLSTTLDLLRSTSLPDQTMTVAAGDLIGGSPFLSGIFHDEPSVESLNLMGLDVSSVGNHEFDEGTEELLRMQEGGCHPDDGCYFPNDPYAGADFPWLAANVVNKDDGQPLLPPTYTQEVAGVPVGFIGMTLEATPSLVSPGGVDTVDFLDEVETANAQAAELQGEGVESIVVLLHEGGFVEGFYNGCDGISGPIVDIAEQLDPAIDMVVTGHTHEPYVCKIADPAGQPRLVTSANQYGRVVTETNLVLSRASGDVIRERTNAGNVLVTQDVVADPAMTDLIAKWADKSDEVAAEVVGTVAEDITGDSSTDRDMETPLADLIADSILFGTDGADEGGAQISFMNVGGVRAELLVNQITNGEAAGEITYAEAFAVMPFGNILVSVDMTGQDIKDVLEQQFNPDRSRQQLALGVSEGFSYTWDAAAAQGSKVSGMELNGVPLDLGATYRVSTLNFLQEGGDDFTAFTRGTNLLGGPEDLANLVEYLQNNPGLTAPADRVDGL